MNTRKVHEIWVEQCDATNEIKLRYGVKAAFDYLVAEKLLNFADAATGRPEFARELPRFVAYVRGLFTPQERLFAGGRWIRTCMGLLVSSDCFVFFRFFVRSGKPFFVPSPAIRFAECAEGVKGPKR